MAVKCFWITPTHTVRVSMRRYKSAGSTDRECPGQFLYHNASRPIGIFAARWHMVDGQRYNEVDSYGNITAGSGLQFPTKCDYCDYAFTDDDAKQSNGDLLYRRVDTSELMTLREAGPGAMWNAWWMSDFWRGPDGMSIMVKCPNGREWCIDSEASNCTMKDDHQKTHKCWVRHGDPPMLTVDKNGPTCAAGGGSIQAGDYHGFLQNGSFT